MKQLSGLILGLTVLASPLVFTLPMGDWLTRTQQIRAGLESLGWAGPWVFLIVTAGATAVGFPRLLFCTLAGWLFGFANGFISSQFGSILGAYVLFLLARRSKPETWLEKYPKLRALNVPAVQGWRSVLVIRQLPIAGIYNDILLGWSAVSPSDFWIGSFLGFLPQGIAATLAGAGIVEADVGSMGMYLAVAATVLAVFHLVKSRTAVRSAINTRPGS